MFPLQVLPMIGWGLIGATAINVVGVLVVVQILKVYIPMLRANAPWSLPVIAVAAGPALGYATTFLTTLLGHPIDLGPILAVLTGTTAVVLHQVGKQIKK